MSFTNPMNSKETPVFITLALCVWLGLFADARLHAAEGGMHSGGGSGVATFIPGAPKTIENLIRVESLAMFKARANHELSGKQPPNDLYPIPAATAQRSEALLQTDIAIQSAKSMLAVRKLIADASPEFFALFAQADSDFSKALSEAEPRYQASLKMKPDGQPVEVPLALIEDFGERVPLAANQAMVQIIKRTGATFEINMPYWKKAGVLDQLDLRTHEDAYGVSWQKDSVRVQKFQLFVIQRYLNDEKIDPKEFQQLAETDWGFFQVNHRAEQVVIPGLRIATESERPYRDTGTTTEDDSIMPPGVPMSSPEGQQCAMLTEAKPEGNAGKLKLLYWDGHSGGHSEKTLSPQEWTMFTKFRDAAKLAILAKLNPMQVPYLYDYLPVMCFNKRLISLFGLGDLRYIEFRKAYDRKKAGEVWAAAQSNAEYDAALYLALRQREDLWMEALRESRGKTPLGIYADKIRAHVEEMKALIQESQISSEWSGFIERTVVSNARALLQSAVERDLDLYSDHWSASAQLLDYGSQESMLAMREESRFLAKSPPLIAPPPYSVFTALTTGQLVRKADPITIIGRLGAFVQP